MPGVLVPERDVGRDVRFGGAPAVPVVALTFDDGPNGACTAAVLDALAATHARATFFVLGANVDAGGNDRVLARIVREGHALGVHGYWHGVRRLFFRDLTGADLAHSVDAITAALARVGLPPVPVRFFRPPFGFLLEPSARAADDVGLLVVEWTVSVGDWRPHRTAEDVVAAILAEARAGDVIVLHDGDRTYQRSARRCVDRPIVADVVRQLVPALAARGLHPAPLAQVLGLDPGPDLTAAAPAH
ncbi:MAG TPA: polysaccharide deacetylase family protein [Candidatus Binatia bacterium]|nr:polysaccharide deacetylase family protein [Candidatus Binatia bacterium]